MKSIRYSIVIITISLLAGISLCGCDNDYQEQNNQPNYSTGVSPYDDTNAITNVNLFKAVDDSIRNQREDIGIIPQETNNIAKRIDENDLSASKSADKDFWLWVAIALGVVDLFLSFICLKKCVNLNARSHLYEETIKKIEEELRKDPLSTRGLPNAKPASDIESLHRRVSELETQLRMLKNGTVQINNQPKQPQVPNNRVEKPATPQCGYFGTPIQASEPYYRKLLISREPEARFSAEVNGNKAIFKPLDSSNYFGTLVSTDAMRVAIDFCGCATAEASSMQVIMPGEAVLKDNKWIITKKSKVQLSL